MVILDSDSCLRVVDEVVNPMPVRFLAEWTENSHAAGIPADSNGGKK